MAEKQYAAIDLKSYYASVEAAERGYDLYVYDGCLPDALPEAGAVLLIDPPRAPEGMTFSGTAEEAGSMTASAASGPAGEQLLENVKLREVAVLDR